MCTVTAVLQGIYDRKQRAEYDAAKRETEIKQLQGWKATVESLVEKFSELIAARAAGVTSSSSSSSTSAPGSSSGASSATAAAAQGGDTPMPDAGSPEAEEADSAADK